MNSRMGASGSFAIPSPSPPRSGCLGDFGRSAWPARALAHRLRPREPSSNAKNRARGPLEGQLGPMLARFWPDFGSMLAEFCCLTALARSAPRAWLFETVFAARERRKAHRHRRDSAEARIARSSKKCAPAVARAHFLQVRALCRQALRRRFCCRHRCCVASVCASKSNRR